MSDSKPEVGSIGWIDLTVPDAEAIQDFYGDVIGWQNESVDMGGYNDFCMTEPASGKANVGICHARAGNAYLPPQWLVYFIVADLDASLAKVVERGGKKVGEIRKMGSQDRYCAIQDPAGAYCVLYEKGS
jgi:uncharacterized protein